MITISKDMFTDLMSQLQNEENFVFLDCSKVTKEQNRSLLFIHPLEILRFQPGNDPAVFFDQIEARLKQGKYVAGSFSYEFGCFQQEKLHSQKHPLSTEEVLVELGVYDDMLWFDHLSGEHTFGEFLKLEDTNAARQKVVEYKEAEYTIGDVTPNMDFWEYSQVFNKIKEYIAAGDTYQVNYTLQLTFPFSGSCHRLYEDLRYNQSVSFGALLQFGNKNILSMSPELFFAKNEAEITMRPMKGTAAKGNTLVRLEKKGKELRADEKNRSENVMIVDMLRNDLSRLFYPQPDAAIWVEKLFEVEEYETLLQMTSTVKGYGNSLASPFSVRHLFRSLFPCGSITGAPKVRTMEIIQELEKSPRGIYTGAIGYLSPDGGGMFNVPIRTVIIENEKGCMGVGSGLVDDSSCKKEWEECLLKAQFLTGAGEKFYLIESMLWDRDTKQILFLELHMKRLTDSASFFLFHHDMEKVRLALSEAVADFSLETSMRIRLTLEKCGTIKITAAPIGMSTLSVHPVLDLPDQIQAAELPEGTVMFYEQQIDTKSPCFFHKTSRRKLFDEQWERARLLGHSDIIFENTSNEITEGCISNIIVYKDGRYCTPPVSSGLLAGVMRSHLLAKGQLVEKKVQREDIENADALFLCNSVRGIRRVKLVKNEV